MSCHLCHRTPRDPVLGQAPDLYTCAGCGEDVCEACAEIEGDLDGEAWVVTAVCRACRGKAA